MPDAVDHGRHLLLPHPVDGPGAARDLVDEMLVRVSSDRGASGIDLRLSFRLKGGIPRIKLPDERTPLRTDGLWRHTCFEAFITCPGSSQYWEYNFSPSGAWAAYQFTGYREGMAPLMAASPPITRRHETDDVFELDATIDLSWLLRTAPPGGLRLGLAAVIEDKQGALSYWALRHPGQKPDFHHQDGFALAIDPSATLKVEPAI